MVRVCLTFTHGLAVVHLNAQSLIPTLQLRTPRHRERKWLIQSIATSKGQAGIWTWPGGWMQSQSLNSAQPCSSTPASARQPRASPSSALSRCDPACFFALSRLLFPPREATQKTIKANTFTGFAWEFTEISALKSWPMVDARNVCLTFEERACPW